MPCTKENMLLQSKELIKMLVMFNSSLSPLPEQRTMVIKLKYHENCPADYEPTYFRTSSSDEYTKFDGKPKRVELGGLSTSHHKLVLNFTGAHWLFDEDGDVGSGEELDSTPAEYSQLNEFDSNCNDSSLMKIQENFEQISYPEIHGARPPSSTPCRKHKSGSGSVDDLQEYVRHLAMTDFPITSAKARDNEDYDDDVTHLDEEISDMTQLTQLQTESPHEVSILAYLQGRSSSSASGGTIALCLKMPEMTCAAALSKLASRKLVINKGTNRWCLAPRYDDDVESITSEFSQASARLPALKVVPKNAALTLSTDKRIPLRKTEEVRIMQPPAVLKRRQPASTDGEGGEDDSYDNGDDLGNMSLSQCSESSSLSQSRSKYSVIERPLRQSIKRSKPSSSLRR
jgi:hypothetical protein